MRDTMPILVVAAVLGSVGLSACSSLLDYDTVQFHATDTDSGLQHDASINGAPTDTGTDGHTRDGPHKTDGSGSTDAAQDTTNEAQTGPDACAPSCDGKHCGDPDGCSSVCTNCASGLTCNTATGKCECKPACNGKKCGDDNSCGGKCMNCPAGEYCSTTSWRCLCKKDCAGKLCGNSDGCGGKCTSCANSQQLCNMSTWTCEDVCIGIDCGAHGTCGVKNGYAVCNCESGYYQPAYRDPTCLPKTSDACTGITCSGHGTCHMSSSIPSCKCDAGYISYRLACIPVDHVGCLDKDGHFVARGKSRCSADDTYIEVCRDEDGDGRMEWAWGAKCYDGGPCSKCIGLKCNIQPCPLDQICIQMVHGSPYNRCETECDCSNCPNCPPGTWAAKCGSFTYNPTTVCNRPCMPGTGCGMFDSHHGVCWPGEGCDSAAP